MFTYAHVKWFYGQSECVYYLNYFMIRLYNRTGENWTGWNLFPSILTLFLSLCCCTAFSSLLHSSFFSLSSSLSFVIASSLSFTLKLKKKQQTLPWVLFLKKCSSFLCCYQMYKFKLLWIYARKKFLSRAQWFYLPLETVPVSSFLTIRSFHSTNLDNHSLSIQSFHLSLVFKIITAASIRRYM